MVLTEATIRNAVRRDKPYKLTDERGLFLFIKPNGAKWGRFRYRFGRKQKLKKGQNTEKEKTLSCGVYPEVSLKEARERRDDFRALLRKGIDPAAQRAADKLATGDTVSVVVNEYLQKLETPPKDGSKARRLSAVTIDKGRSFLERFILPLLGSRPIGPITETCVRTRQWCGKVWRFAVVTGRAARDITPDLHGAFSPVRVTNHPAIIERGCPGDFSNKEVIRKCRTLQLADMDLGSMSDGPLPDPRKRLVIAGINALHFLYSELRARKVGASAPSVSP